MKTGKERREDISRVLGTKTRAEHHMLLALRELIGCPAVSQALQKGDFETLQAVVRGREAIDMLYQESDSI